MKRLVHLLAGVNGLDAASMISSLVCNPYRTIAVDHQHLEIIESKITGNQDVHTNPAILLISVLFKNAPYPMHDLRESRLGVGFVLRLLPHFL